MLQWYAHKIQDVAENTEIAYTLRSTPPIMLIFCKLSILVCENVNPAAVLDAVEKLAVESHMRVLSWKESILDDSVSTV
jgi:hypothetical protein